MSPTQISLPLAWAIRAARCPARSLHLGLMLWHLSKGKRNREVPVDGRWLKPFGFDRYGLYRALKELEDAGLITVFRHPGRQSLVTLLIPATAEEEAAAQLMTLLTE